MSGKISVSIKNGVGEIVFFHPQSNSLPGELLRSLADAINDFSKNEEVKVIVLMSEGDKAFCAGASFDELIAINDIETGKIFFSGFAGVINAIRKSPKFVIARVQGKAVGGGVGIAAAADYTIATANASIKLSELAVGIGPFVVGPAVERKVGNAAFCHLTMNANAWQTAHWAMQKGLYNSVHDTVEELDEAINDLSNQLALSNPEAMSMLKKVFWEGTENWDTLLLERAAMSGHLVLSDFTRNAITKFKVGSRS